MKIMKRLIYIIAGACVLGLGSCQSDGDSALSLHEPQVEEEHQPGNSRATEYNTVSVTLTEAGTLAARLDSLQKATVEKLVVSGPIDADDVQALRDSLPQLKVIDLAKATIKGGEKTYTSKYSGTTYGPFTLKDNEVGEMMLADRDNLLEVVLPDSVTKVDKEAFKSCGKLAKVTLGAATQSLETDAFIDCTNLNAINLPEGLKKIGQGAFYRCEYLGNVELPEGLEVIGYRAFYNCYNLTKIKLPESLKQFGYESEEDTNLGYVFEGCSKLSSVTLPAGMTEIPRGAFQSCSALSSITLPESLTTIGESAFRSSGLTSINLHNGLKQIGSNAFEECKFYSITLPQSADIEWGIDIFKNCDNLGEVTIPDTWTTIPGYMFGSCSKLSTVNLPNGLETIGNGALQYCGSLSYIELPASLKTIGYQAFCNSALSYINIPEQVTAIGDRAFYECSNLSQVSFPESLTSIGGEAFYNTKLITVSLPSQLESVGYGTFKSCMKLLSVDIPSKLKEISAAMFYDCYYLQEVHISAPIERILRDAFGYCRELIIAELPETLKTIDNNAFYDCQKLSDITLPDGLQLIKSSAFYNCDSWKDIVIPSGTVAEEAFEGCAPTSITIGANVKSVATDAFWTSDLRWLNHVVWNSKAIVPDLNTYSGYDYNINVNTLFYFNGVKPIVANSNYRNRIYDGVAESIILSSTAPSGYCLGNFYCPKEFKAKKISYTRNFSFPTYPGEAAGWRSISLPFTVSDISHIDGRKLAPFYADAGNAKPFWLRRLTSAGYENATQIEANVPYIIAMPNNAQYAKQYNIVGDVTFSAESAEGITIPVTTTSRSDGPDYSLSTNYFWMSKSTSGIYVLNEDSNDSRKAGSVFVQGSRDIVPFEAIVKSNGLTRSFPIERTNTRSAGKRELSDRPMPDDM